MAALALPSHAVPTLSVTAIATLARRLRRRKKSTAPSPTPYSQPCHLQWNNISCSLSPTKRNPEKHILRNVSGHASPGRVFAILGPSGAGKTTLLNAISGRVPAATGINLEGAVLFNGISDDSHAIPIAYVTQQDLFFSQLTGHETLQIAADLRMPRNATKEHKGKVLDDIVASLALEWACRTRVGDNSTRGISGGERKRLSLACELISSPSIILCDEPTSGLDAFQAERVIMSLRRLAAMGNTVICSIHQPSSSIFKMLDDIALLTNGALVYSGPASDAPSYFANLNHPLPEQCNPAEAYLELMSVDSSTPESLASSRRRIDTLISAWASQSLSNPTIAPATPDKIIKSTPEGSLTPEQASVEPVGVDMFKQIKLLLGRAWKQMSRDKKTNISRFMSSLMSALLFGSIYWRIGRTQSTIQDRLGLLQVCTINSAMTALIKTLNVFSKESTLVNRERARGSYSVLPYFISKLVAEMPISAFFPLVFSLTVYPMVQLSGGLARILRFVGIITLESFTAASYGLFIGALMPSTEAALAVGPSSFVLQIVFGGLYITDDNVPRWAGWIPRISLIKHAYEALCVNEFRGLEFEAKRPWDIKKGEQVLQRMSWGDSSVSKACISQARVLAFNYLATFAVLTLKKPRYEKLHPPADSEDREQISELS